MHLTERARLEIVIMHFEDKIRSYREVRDMCNDKNPNLPLAVNRQCLG